MLNWSSDPSEWSEACSASDELESVHRNTGRFGVGMAKDGSLGGSRLSMLFDGTTVVVTKSVTQRWCWLVLALALVLLDVVVGGASGGR